MDLDHVDGPLQSSANEGRRDHPDWKHFVFGCIAGIAPSYAEKLCEVVPTYRPDSVRTLEIGVGSETVHREV